MRHCKESQWDDSEAEAEYSAAVSEVKTRASCIAPLWLWSDFSFGQKPEESVSMSANLNHFISIVQEEHGCWSTFRDGKLEPTSGKPQNQMSACSTSSKYPTKALSSVSKSLLACPFIRFLQVLTAQLYLCQPDHHWSKVEKERSVPYMSSVQYNGTLWSESHREQSLFRKHSAHLVAARCLFGYDTMHWYPTVTS